MKRITKYLTLFLVSILLFLTSCISNSNPGEVVYTITYHTNATPTTITKEYNKDSLLTESEVSSLSISKEGFTKEYWYLDSNYNEKVTFPYTISKNEDFYLKWIKDEIPTSSKFTINFYVDKKIYETKIVDKDAILEAPEAPNKEDSFFKGWYDNEEGNGTSYDFTKPITKDVELYAVFTSTPIYEITFVVEGMNLPSQYIEENNVLEETIPSKPGYTFEAWYENEDFDGEPFDINTKITKPYTLYGKMNKNKYNVLFYNDSTLIETQEVLYKETASNPSSTPSKTGYTFKDWSLDPTTYQKFSFDTLIEKETKIYAYFEINTYTVTFYNETKVIETKKVEYNTKVDKPNDPVVDEYDFDDWYTDTTYTKKFDFNSNITKDTKVYAHLTKQITYTVTFEVEGTVYETQTVVENKKAKQPTEPTKDEYSFIGWYLNNSPYSFNSAVTEDITLVAQFEKTILNITSFGGYNEGAYIVFDKLPNVPISDYTIYYKTDSSTYNEVNHNLIREQGSSIRCDIIGLEKGNYTLKVEVNHDTPLSMTKNVVVYEDDRSGYAHFGYTKGIGAYNDNGTLKSNAVVVYVTDQNKNTVTATIGSKTYTGLVAIIQACTNSSYALDIRIIGEIKTTQWNAKSHGEGNTSTRQENLENLFNYVNDTSGWDENSSSNYSKLNQDKIISKGINSMSNDEANGITKLNGLTNQVLRNKKADSKTGAYEYDSYYNMLDVSKGCNITIEGIGTDAAIFQWGFAFKQCNSIEIKNLRFYNYTEDAVGFEGGSSSNNDFGNYWIHNCTFDIGVNNWDVCYEGDKGDGDGSSDVKYCHNVTISYTQYNGTHKTNLIGSSDSALQYNITLHHNFYNKAGSRLPLVRQANIHIYNNYYLGSKSYSHSIRAHCYAFVENCYYDGGQNPYETVSDGVIKSYNNIYNNVKLSGSSYKKENTVTSRTAKVDSTCKPDGSTDYSNFDTNSNLFYYDSVNQKSKVSILTDTKDVPEYCKTYSGVLKSTFTPKEDNQQNPDEPSTTYTITYNTNGGSTITSSIVNENSTLKLPGNPTKENYTFDGWYTDEALKNKFDSTTKITKNMTLYAKWKEKVAGTLTFDISQLEDATLSSNTSAGDFTLSNGIIIATSGDSKIIKTGGNSSFKDDKRLIKFETTSSCTVSVTFASQNATATDRYVILYDSSGKEVARSSTTLTGSAQSTYAFTITTPGNYSFGTYGGIIIYDIVVE